MIDKNTLTKHTSSSQQQSTKPRVPRSAIHLLKIEVGQVTSAKFLKKARNPSYEIKLDFGQGEGNTKTTCGQLVNNYTPEALAAKQVVSITNFPPRRIAGVKSAVLTLGFPEAPGSQQAIFIAPAEAVPNGTLANFAREDSFVEDADFAAFLALEIRAGTLQKIETKGAYTVAWVDLGDMGQRIAWIPGKISGPEAYRGKQVAVWLNPTPCQVDEKLTCDSILLVLPHAPYGSQTTDAYHQGAPIATPVTLMTPSKSVQDGLELF